MGGSGKAELSGSLITAAALLTLKCLQSGRKGSDWLVILLSFIAEPIQTDEILKHHHFFHTAEKIKCLEMYSKGQL